MAAKAKLRKFNLPGSLLGVRFSQSTAKKLPFLKITAGNSTLVGVKTVVRKPREAGTIVSEAGKGRLFFRKGEKILRIHIDSASVGEIGDLIIALENNIGNLKKAGFGGFYGYSSNHRLLKVFKTKFSDFSTADISVPEKEAAWERKNYANGMKRKGFSGKYANNEIKGIAVRL